ncbi:AsmA family protein [Candidatus Omnitrophota bacterium]
MRKITLIILLIVILLIVSLAIGIHYLNTYYLPKVIKAKIIQEAAKQLDIDIGVGDIKFELFKGIVLHNLSISNKNSPIPNLQIDRVSATLLIFPLFNQKKIIFPSINIYGPKYDIIRLEGNKFNFQDFIPKQINQGKTSSPYSFLIYRIDIFDSQINFLDKTTHPNIVQALELKNLGIQISPSGLNFNLHGKLINDKQTSLLKLSGNFKFETSELNISSELDKLNALPYLVYFKELPVNIKSLLLENIDAKCTLLENKLSVTANANTTDAHLITSAQLAKEQTIISNASAKLNVSLNFNLGDMSSLDYIVGVDRLKANLETPIIPDKVDINYGRFQISPDILMVKYLSINTLQTKFFIKGDLENFSDPIFDVNVKSSVDLAATKDLLITYFDFVKPIIIDGKADVSVNLLKSKSKKDVDFKGSLDLKNASIKTSDTPYAYEINKINGVVNFQKDKFEWSNLSFSLLDKFFYSKATILTKPPLVDLELYSDKINIRTKLSTVQENSYYIDYLKASYYNSKFDASGNLDIKDKGYYIDLKLNSLIDLEDLKQIENLPQEQLSKINPEGKCKIEGRIQGNAKYPTLLTALLSLSVKELNVYGYKIADLEMQLAQENRQIKIPQANCKFYDGAIYLNGLIDLEKESLPYAFKIIGDDINLAKLKLDIPIDDENLRGALSSTVILSGQMDSIQDLKAQGEFLVQDGYLWGFNPLKKLGDFLFIPKYETLIFQEAKGNFNIQNRKIFFENVILGSDVLLLSCEGTIGFMGNLDLDITPKPLSDITESLDEYEKFFAGIFSEAGGVVSVKITGTVQEPKFEKKIILLQVLDKAKDAVVDKIKVFTDLIFGNQE